MSADKYAALDAAIIETIRSGHAPNSNENRMLAEPLTKLDRWGEKFPARVIDRRVQALRKSGRIAYEASQSCAPRRWVVCGQDATGAVESPAPS